MCVRFDSDEFSGYRGTGPNTVRVLVVDGQHPLRQWRERDAPRAHLLQGRQQATLSPAVEH